MEEITAKDKSSLNILLKQNKYAGKKKHQPLVSVIVPVYNAREYLAECLDSILSQSYRNLELVLIDDGSMDGSGELCEVYGEKDQRIRVLHQKNRGAGAARNAGIKASTGVFLTFVDADDCINHNMIETFVALITAHKADMVISAPDPVKRNAGKIKEWEKKDCLDRFFRIHKEPDVHYIWGSLYSRALFAGFSFLEGKMNEDVHACYVLARSCRRAVYINKNFYHYRKNAGGVTNSVFTMKKTDLMDVWDCVYEMVCKDTPEYKGYCKINRKRAKFTLLSKMYIDGFDQKDQELISLKAQLQREVRDSFFELMRWKMPLSRKVLLLLLCAISRKG